MDIEELYIGQTASLTRVFTSDDVELFAWLSSDYNPLHLDIQYARSSLFGKRIVHGFLVGSLISAILGTKLPGPGAVYLNQNMNFRKPVYHDDSVTAVVEVTAINRDKRIIYFDTKCINGNGDIVIDGNAVIKLM